MRLFYCLLLLIGFSNTGHALKKSEKELLYQIHGRGFNREAFRGFNFTSKDLEDPILREIHNFSILKTEQFLKLREVLDEYCGIYNDFRVLYPEGDLGFVGHFFAELQANTHVLTSGGLRNDLMDSAHALLPAKLRANVTYEYNRDTSAFYKDLYYFSHDLIFLDVLLTRWAKVKSFEDISQILTSIMENIPLMVLELPCGLKSLSPDPRVNQALANPEQFFARGAPIQVVPIPRVKRYPRNLYLVLMTGAKVGGKLYRGKMIKYKALHHRMCWCGPDVVVKQYHRGRSTTFEGVDKYNKTLKFFEYCKDQNIQFIPTLLYYEEQKDRAFILMSNEGGPLNHLYQVMSDPELKLIIVQILDIFVTLEKLNVSPRDIKGNNFLVNKRGKVSLIDFDNAQFDKTPNFTNFLRVMWDMLNEECISSAESKKLIGSLGIEDCKRFFGKIGSVYAEPILFQRVKSFRELEASVKNK